MKNIAKILLATLHGLVIGMIVLIVKPVYASVRNDYPINTNGGLVVGVARGEKTALVLIDEPTLLKSALDNGWQYMRAEWNSRIIALINELSSEKVEITSELATIDQAELQVAKVDGGVSLTYVLHNNTMRLVLKDVWAVGDLTYKVNFDIALTLTIQSVHQRQPIQLADVSVVLQTIKIDGEDWLSDLMLPLAETLLQQVQAYTEVLTSTLLSSMKEVWQQFIGAIFAPIPTDAIYLDIDVDPQDGAIVLCFKPDSVDACHFPAR